MTAAAWFVAETVRQGKVRLHRLINDKSIGNAVQKPIEKLAGRHSVDPEDVAEMSLPDNGLQ